MLRDILNHPQVTGSTLRFVDINEERLTTYDKIAHKLNRFLEIPITIESTTDRRAVLAGSDYVIVSVDTGHYHTWEQDFNVPIKLGSKQILGELGDQSKLSEELRIDPFFAPRSWADTLAFPIISAIEGNYFHRMPAINMVNTGQIANLPYGIFVETPAVVDGSGIYPVSMGELPKALAAFNRRDIDQTELIVEAGTTGDTNLVLQAMLLDPVIDNAKNTEQILDEMLKINAQYLPQFA